MGTLYIVGTPIGNSKDITLRAIEVLKEVDSIYAEDTRVTRKLLSLHSIENMVKTYHHHSKENVMAVIYDDLVCNKNIALVSDAGSPGISDPGGKLIEYITKKNSDIKIEPIPGVSSLTTAISISGFPTDTFTFYGFIPHKKGRKKLIKEICMSKTTGIFFESPHRIHKTLKEMAEVNKKKECMIGRELTKKFESIYRGTIEELHNENIPEKGEFVVVVRGK